GHKARRPKSHRVHLLAAATELRGPSRGIRRGAYRPAFAHDDKGVRAIGNAAANRVVTGALAQAAIGPGGSVRRRDDGPAGFQGDEHISQILHLHDTGPAFVAVRPVDPIRRGCDNARERSVASEWTASRDE